MAGLVGALASIAVWAIPAQTMPRLSNQSYEYRQSIQRGHSVDSNRCIGCKGEDLHEGGTHTEQPLEVTVQGVGAVEEVDPCCQLRLMSAYGQIAHGVGTRQHHARPRAEEVKGMGGRHTDAGVRMARQNSPYHFGPAWSATHTPLHLYIGRWGPHRRIAYVHDQQGRYLHRVLSVSVSYRAYPPAKVYRR